MKIPAGAQVIDLSRATVLPGLIDAHTHMFNTRKPNGTTEASMLIAVQNVQADLRAGFTAARDMSTHGNGYGDIAIRDAINQGRIDGPRYQVSTLGIVWGAKPPTPRRRRIRWPAPWSARSKKRAPPCASRSHTARTGSSCSRPARTPSRRRARPQYVVTYPLPVLQALIDETHRLGKKAGCHVYGGEGQKNAIVAGCDTIEHGFGLDQEQVNMMVAKGLYYDPDARSATPSRTWTTTTPRTPAASIASSPFSRRPCTMAAATKGMKIMVGSGVDGATFAHGTQALEFEALVKHGGLTPARAIQAAPSSTPKRWDGRTRSARSTRASTPI